MSVLSSLLPSSSDQSVTVLSQIFGSPITDILTGSMSVGQTNLITLFIGNFDFALSSFFIIIFGIILVIGTINTAHEGKFLGKNWSSIWVPLRAIFTPIAIFPLNGGFCFLQYVLMYFILLGAGVATSVWNKSIADVNIGYVPTVPASLSQSVNQSIALAFLYGSVDQILNGGKYSGVIENADITQAGVTVNQFIQMANTDTSGSSTGPRALLNALTGFDSSDPNAEPSGGFIAEAFQGIGADTSTTGTPWSDNYQFILNGSITSGTRTGANGEPWGFEGAYKKHDTREGDCDNDSGSGEGPCVYQTLSYNGANILTTMLSNQWAASGINQASGAASYHPDDSGGNPPNMNQFTLTPILFIGSNYVAGPGTTGDQYGNGTTTAPDGMFTASLSNATISYDFQINQNAPPNSVTLPANLPFTPTFAGIEAYLRGGSGAPFTYQSTVGTSTAPAPPAANSNMGNVACANVNSCSFTSISNDFISSLMQQQQQAPQQPISQMVFPGTGGTCAPTCISSSSTPDHIVQPNVTTGTGSVPYTDTIYSSSAGPEAPADLFPVQGSSCFTSGNTVDPQAWVTTACMQQSNNINAELPVYSLIQGQNYGGSWWYAGEVYLGLAQQMSKNLDQLADDVSELGLQTSQPIFKITGGANVQYCTTMVVGLSETDNYTTSNIADPDFPLINSKSGPSLTYYQNSGPLSWPTPSSNQVCFNAPAQAANVSIGGNWADIVNYIFVGGSSGYSQIVNDGAQPTQQDAQNLNAMLSTLQWPDNLYYQALMNLPAALQQPFEMLVLVNQKTDTASNPVKPGVATYAVNGQAFAYAPGTLTNYVENILAVLMVNNIITNPFNPANNVDPTYGSNVDLTNPLQGVLSNIFNGLLFSGGDQMGQNFANLMNQIYNLGSIQPGTPAQLANQQFNMIATAQTLGEQMIALVMGSISTVEDQYKTLAIATTTGLTNAAAATSAVGLAAGAVPFESLGPTIVSAAQLVFQVAALATSVEFSFHLIWLPLVIVVMSSLFVAGVGFAIILPLTPFILFWVGQMAWLLGVIEAMIAAPLILLGIAHPGGHDVLGHATPAVKLFLGIVFRPVLMVLGLLVGITLTFIVITLSSQAFHIVGISILGTNNGPGAQMVMDANVRGILACILVMIYVTFIMLAFTKCFSAIYSFPEKVVQWIGGQAEKAGPEELQQVTQAANKTAQDTSQAGGQVAQGSMSASRDSAQGGFNVGGQGASVAMEGIKARAATKKGQTDSAAQTGSSNGGSGSDAGIEGDAKLKPSEDSSGSGSIIQG